MFTIVNPRVEIIPFDEPDETWEQNFKLHDCVGGIRRVFLVVAALILVSAIFDGFSDWLLTPPLLFIMGIIFLGCACGWCDFHKKVLKPYETAHICQQPEVPPIVLIDHQPDNFGEIQLVDLQQVTTDTQHGHAPILLEAPPGFRIDAPPTYEEANEQVETGFQVPIHQTEEAPPSYEEARRK